MEWIERLNQAIHHIETHLTEEIDYDALAKIACCSVFHFQRMFAYMANVPLSEYIRRRKMSLAATELQNSDVKIIDIALKYGYASPTAFNRAFQSIHGTAPSHVKEAGMPLKTFPPISFKITITGAEEMNYRIENREAFRVIGVSHPLQKDVEQNFEVVPQMWYKASTDGTIPRLTALMDSQPMGVLGVSICTDDDNWRYMLAVASTKTDEAFETYTVPAFTWAIFSGSGQAPLAIQDLERRIVTEWLPTSGYEYANGPDIEVYLNPDPQDAKFEVWVPVKKK